MLGQYFTRMSNVISLPEPGRVDTEYWCGDVLTRVLTKDCDIIKVSPYEKANIKELYTAYSGVARELFLANCR